MDSTSGSKLKSRVGQSLWVVYVALVLTVLVACCVWPGARWEPKEGPTKNFGGAIEINREDWGFECDLPLTRDVYHSIGAPLEVWRVNEDVCGQSSKIFLGSLAAYISVAVMLILIPCLISKNRGGER